MKTKASGTIFQVLFRIMGIVILIQGIRMMGEGVYNYIDEHNQQDWVSTSAYVVDISREYSHSSKRSSYSYDITYQYEVGGETYSGMLYNMGQPMALGDSVEIKYDPELPEDSTYILEPSLSNLVIFLIFGAVLTVIGFFMSGAWAFIRKIRRKGEPEEEEILPPEEYVEPEEMEQSSINSGKAILFRIVLAVLIVVVIMLSAK